MLPYDIVRTIEAIHDIPANPAQVWEVLMDFPRHAEWNPLFASIEGEASVGKTLKVATRGSNGKAGLRFVPTVLQVLSPVHLIWRGHFLFSALFQGIHEFELEELRPNLTRLYHRERFSGMMVPFLGRMLKETEEGFHAMNKALEQEVLARHPAP